MGAFGVAVALLVLFAGAALADADAKPSSTWLKDYLDPSEVASAMSYDKAQREDVCFQQTSYCYNDCYLGGSCSSQFELATMTCAKCHASDYNHGSKGIEYLGSSLTLSKCLTKRNLFKEYSDARGNVPAGLPINGSVAGLSWVGSFTATCYLFDTHGECLPGGCDQVIVEIRGSAFRLEEAVRQGLSTCSSWDCLDKKRKAPASSGKKAAGSKAAPTAGRAAGFDGCVTPQEGKVLTGPVEIYSGHIVSTSRPDKIEGGSYQYAWFTDREDLVPKDPAAVTYLLPIQDEMHKFQFVRERKQKHTPHS